MTATRALLGECSNGDDCNTLASTYAEAIDSLPDVFMVHALSKTRLSFYRRLYLAHLIDQGTRSVPALVEATGMPRRTAQDTIASLSELDIECTFEPTPGERHNSGRYVIENWGAINRDWVAANAERLGTTLGYR